MRLSRALLVQLALVARALEALQSGLSTEDDRRPPRLLGRVLDIPPDEKLPSEDAVKQPLLVFTALDRLLADPEEGEEFLS